MELGGLPANCPQVQGSMSASADEITRALASYVIAAIMTAPVGWLAVRYGRKARKVIIAAAPPGLTMGGCCLRVKALIPP